MAVRGKEPVGRAPAKLQRRFADAAALAGDKDQTKAGNNGSGKTAIAMDAASAEGDLLASDRQIQSTSDNSLPAASPALSGLLGPRTVRTGSGVAKLGSALISPTPILSKESPGAQTLSRKVSDNSVDAAAGGPSSVGHAELSAAVPVGTGKGVANLDSAATSPACAADSRGGPTCVCDAEPGEASGQRMESARATLLGPDPSLPLRMTERTARLLPNAVAYSPARMLSKESSEAGTPSDKATDDSGHTAAGSLSGAWQGVHDSPAAVLAGAGKSAAKLNPCETAPASIRAKGSSGSKTPSHQTTNNSVGTMASGASSAWHSVQDLPATVPEAGGKDAAQLDLATKTPTSKLSRESPEAKAPSRRVPDNFVDAASGGPSSAWPAMPGLSADISRGSMERTKSATILTNAARPGRAGTNRRSRAQALSGSTRIASVRRGPKPAISRM